MPAININLSAQKFGQQIMRGALAELWLWFISALFFGWLFLGLTGMGQDDTDKDAWHRSNLELLTDHRTGVQYLRSGSALTPRLDAEGHIMRATEGK